jgi:uncharacterized protein (TIGR02118 family)
MDWVCEIACTGEPNRAEDARAWVDAVVPTWNALAGLTALDLYRPVEGRARDPFNDDGSGPLFIAMLAFPTREALRQAMAKPAFSALPPGLVFTGTCFERRFYPVSGEAKASPLTAPFSYVVRYYRPADDEPAFIKNYVETHPPTLATLPGIRSVMCYFPQDIVAPTLPAADYMIGNEVVFDSVEVFNTAMQSPVRQELRRHFHEFPRFTGRNTHFPMNRTRLFG